MKKKFFRLMADKSNETTDQQDKPKEHSKKNKKSNSNDLAIPDKLKEFITPEVWHTWSPIRRESFKKIVENPNAFFYRNRPPGDPQKCGKFSAEEEAQFLERLTYFKTLGITDGLWGLFSVPILGRLGYQCSNFYRALVKEGKIIDSRYQIDEEGKLKFKHSSRSSNPEALAILEKEAFEFIEKCLKPENGEVPKISPAIHVFTPPTEPKSNQHKFTSPKIFMPKQLPYSVFDGFGRQRTIGDRLASPECMVRLGIGAKIGSARIKKSRECISIDGDQSPYFGCPDPLSGKPIIKPMMDQNGYIMDLKSWKKVFEKGVKPPFDSTAGNLNDLTEINASNFESMKRFVKNFVC